MYKILIADDEELELKSMRIFLERNYPDAEILPNAKNGTQVVEITVREQPDILILDIEMPGLNGLKALKILRDQGYDGHVIVKTAYGRFVYAQDALHLHVDAYLLKPVKKAELKERLDEVFLELEEKNTKDRKEESSGRNFVSGFILSLIFPKDRYKELFESEGFGIFQAELPKRLSLICDFTLCPAEENVLPMLIYSADAMDEFIYRQLSADLPEVLNDICVSVFGIKPEIKQGCLISDIYEQLPKTYYSVFRERERNTAANDYVTGSQHLNKVLSYMKAHFGEDISLETAAAYAKLNASYLSHLFKRHLNKNFVEYLTEIRMKKAIELIEQGTDNVKELSGKVGYQYPSYFCRQFKKYTGYTVGEYKRFRVIY